MAIIFTVKSGRQPCERLHCDREPTNERDRYVVAVKKAGVSRPSTARFAEK